MLLDKIHEEIQASGLGAGNDFKIAASAKAFEILSSNLYQDKILAVIRELSCNAADAHTSVGKPLSDIQIKLPTYGDLTFKVRDFGPGLSDEDVRHLYTTYFQSTKDGSNEAIGGFGLGSKSPFALVDQFNVRSFHGGFVRTYVCYKNSGIPAINFISAEPSDETGLEVSLAVPTTDTGRVPDVWASRAADFFRWWPDNPFFVGGPISPIYIGHTKTLASQHIVATNQQPLWFITNTINKPYVWMGLVPYALNLGAVPNLPPEIVSVFSGVGLVLNIPIGGVEISPSREALSYDPKTCAVITKLLQTIYKEVTAELLAALDKCPTLYEAREFLHASDSPIAALQSSTILRNLKQQTSGLRWKGKAVNTTVHLDLTALASPAPVSYSAATFTKVSWRSTWRRSSAAAAFGHRFTNYGLNVFVWVPAITAKTYATLQHYGTTLFATSSQRELTFHIVAGQTYAETQTLFEEAGFPPLLDGTTLPPPPKVASTRTSTPTNTQGYRYGSTEFEPTSQPLDLTVPGLYSPIFDGNVKTTYGTGGWLQESQIYEVWRANLFDTTLYPKALGFKTSQLDTRKLSIALAANKWKPLTWDTIVEITPATNLEASLRARRLGYLIHTELPPKFITFLQLSRGHQTRTQFLTTFVPALFHAANGAKFFQPYAPTIQPFVNITVSDLDHGAAWSWFRPLVEHPAVAPLVSKIEQEMEAYLTTLEKMVADHPLLWHIALAASDLPYADLISYLSRND